MRRLLLVAVLLLVPEFVAAQGRDFDGANDNVKTSDNALAGLSDNQRSIAYWVRCDATGAPYISLLTQDGAGTTRTIEECFAPASSGWRTRWTETFSTTNGVWVGPDITIAGTHHIAITYDRSDVANDPVMYINGASVTVTETTAPVGTASGSEDTVKMGESASGATDFNGVLQNVVAQSGTLWSAAAVNRAKWWGRPHGGVLFWYPFYTTTLTDTTGSGQATLTATGSAMVSLTTPTVRPGTAMLGMGVGW